MSIFQNSYVINLQNSPNILPQIHTLKSSNSHLRKFSSMKIDPFSDHKIIRKPNLYLAITQTTPPIIYNVLHSSSHPLDYGTHTSMEQRLGHDFNQVQIGYEGTGR